MLLATTNINKAPSINSSAKIFVFEDCSIFQKD